jgi:hypothetical protein
MSDRDHMTPLEMLKEIEAYLCFRHIGILEGGKGEIDGEEITAMRADIRACIQRADPAWENWSHE